MTPQEAEIFFTSLTSDIKKKNVSRIRKQTFYLQFCMGTPECDTPKVKKKIKDTCGIYPTKFASSTQQDKKVIETLNQPIETSNLPIRTDIFPKNSMFSTLKV
jgi:hypothetical protein